VFQEINVNETPTNRQDTHKTLRDSLIDAILFRIEQDVEDAMPPDVSKELRKAILGEILPNSRFVLDALSIEQLQSGPCLERHLEGAIATARYLVHRITAQRERS
jgi:hypothetical protein